MQQILFAPESDWQVPSMSDMPSWKNAKRVCVDVETRDEQLKTLGPGVRRGAYIAGIGFAIEDGPAHYLPFAHAQGQQLPKENVLNYVRDQAADFSGTVVFANASYDLDFLEEVRITFPKAEWIRDVQVADPLINELHHKYSLDAIAERHGCPLKVEDKLREAAEAWKVDPKVDLWKLDPKFCGEYGEGDVRNPLLILRRQERILDEAGLWEIYNLESKVTPILVKMRRHGVRIDFEKLHYIRRWCEDQIQSCLSEIKRLTGRQLSRDDLTLPEALGRFFLALGIPVNRTAGRWNKKQGRMVPGPFNIDKAFLSGCGHEAGALLLRARKVQKLTDTFANSILAHATNGRIHPTYNQMKKSKDQDDEGTSSEGAAYGRLSSAHPNIQQQPSRDEFAKMWRSIYLPDEGKLWACNDYSQQEPRLTLHYAALCRCPGSHIALQRYIDDPMTDAYTLLTEITGLGQQYGPKKGRDYAKTITLGLAYGMGGGKLAKSLGLPTATKEIDGQTRIIAGPEAQSILDTFNSNAPYIRDLAKQTERKAKQTGIIKTLGGRHCHFPLAQVGNQGQYDWTHKALNRLIQGSAADQTKAALVQAYEAGFKVQLQVHDELDLSVENREEAEALADIMRSPDIMRNGKQIKVPMRVDVEIGPNWGELS